MSAKCTEHPSSPAAVPWLSRNCCMDVQCETMLLSQVTPVTISLSSVPRGTFSAPGAPVIYMAECSALSWVCPPGSPCMYRTDSSYQGFTKPAPFWGWQETSSLYPKALLWCLKPHQLSELFSNTEWAESMQWHILSSAKTLEHSFEEIQTPYSHHGACLKISQAVQMLSQETKHVLCWVKYHCPNGTLNGSAESCRKCVITWQ